MNVIQDKPATLHIVHGGMVTEQDSTRKIQRDLALLVAEEKGASAKGHPVAHLVLLASQAAKIVATECIQWNQPKHGKGTMQVQEAIYT